MSIKTESRTMAEIIEGAVVYWVPDGEPYGTGDKTASKDNVPTFEEAVQVGKVLGCISNFKLGAEYKTVTKKAAVNPETQRYESRDLKILQKVKPTFTTQDVNPEAYALEHGLQAIPAVGESCQPFANASGVLRGHLYIQLLDSGRTSGEDGEIAQLYFRGDLGLGEAADNTDEFKTINYEFNVTSLPQDGFKNIAIMPEA